MPPASLPAAAVAIGLWAAGGCTQIADYGPERSLTPGPALLYAQDFEASSGPGRCDGERPAVSSPVAAKWQADCDGAVAPLEGAQSLRLVPGGFVDCAPCWKASADLWATFRMRAEPGASDGGMLFVFEEARGLAPPYTGTDRVGPALFWDDQDGAGSLSLGCGRFGDSQRLPAAAGVVHRLTFHYVATTGRGELWSEDQPGAGIVVQCMPAPAPSGFGSQNESEARGLVWLDDLRVALTREAAMAP